MGNYQTYFFAFIIFVFVLSACETEKVIEVEYLKDTVYVDSSKGKGFRIKNFIHPEEPKIGDPIMFVFENLPEDMHIEGYYVNDRWQYQDDLRDDTVYGYFPLIPNEGSLEFAVEAVNGYEQRSNLAYTYYVCDYYIPTGVEVIWNDEREFTKSDLQPGALKYEDHPEWEFETSGDTVIIKVRFSLHDEASERLIWKFLDRGVKKLPEFIEHTRHWNESNGASSTYFNDTLKQGLIKIDKWNDNGLYSGKVYAEVPYFHQRVHMNARSVFLIDTN